MGKSRSLSMALAQRGGVIPHVCATIIPKARSDGAEAFDFGPAKKRGFHVAVSDPESIPENC
jgi:hypothetical protein